MYDVLCDLQGHNVHFLEIWSSVSKAGTIVYKDTMVILLASFLPFITENKLKITYTFIRHTKLCNMYPALRFWYGSANETHS